jgi:carbamoylphosphate synthase large subunit
MTKVRILMTCIGGTLAPDLLNHYKNDSILKPYVVGVDASLDALGKHFVDKFYNVPMGDSDEYIETLYNIVRKEKINLVIPGSDQEAFKIADHQEELKDLGANILTSPSSVLNLIKNKFFTYQKLKTEGIQVPKYNLVKNIKELKDSLIEYGYPEHSVIVKPVAGRGGRGLRVLISEKHPLHEWIGGGLRESRINQLPESHIIEKWFNDGDLLVMEALKAPAYDADIYAENGIIKYAILRQRINPAGIPFEGNIILPDSPIINYCKNVSRVLGLNGLHDFDFMTDKDDNPALLEINPRMSGSAVASHSAGYPIVNAAIASSLGINYPIEQLKSSFTIKSHVNTFLIK